MVLPSENLRNNGMVEQWNFGYQNRIMVWFYFLNRAIQIKTDIIEPNACLHHSITPVFHYSTAYEYGTANLL